MQLPKSFLTVNVSDKHEKDAQEKAKGAGQMMQEDDSQIRSADLGRGRPREVSDAEGGGVPTRSDA